MNKRIEGTFADYQRMLVAINDMLAEGYSAKQLLVITREEEGHRLEEDTKVDVVVTSDQEDSLWDRIVSFFTVEMDEDDSTEEVEEVDEEKLFEDYGIDSDTYERFEEALDNGEYLLLVDAAPPAHVEHSEFMVRDGIIDEEEDIMDQEKNNQPVDDQKKSAQPDWASGNDISTGDVENHSRKAEKDVTSDNEKPSQILVDKNVSHPVADESMDRVSKDPFGMDTEAVEKGEGAKDVDPDYDETEKNPPAL
ncbi:general stress protein [Jeotgalibaca sp. MA1X17-3]|uniref:general stress protein n=1 Tax=Jeotgalibaca sp. MA1X17-3 TaxID=2908211 RepID=UPI001F33DA7B|nr:general stress protein [Jeotgalibaca sp. MA1X17-3]UJF15223.1 general stress protein [Jeotgalibaca sp. MA1X17-3]